MKADAYLVRALERAEAISGKKENWELAAGLLAGALEISQRGFCAGAGRISLIAPPSLTLRLDERVMHDPTIKKGGED